MRIVGPPIDRIGRLPVAQRRRHIGLAEHDRTRRLQSLHSQRILTRDMLAVKGETPSRRVSAQIEAFLHRHRNAGERLLIAARQCLIGQPRLRSRPLEIADHNRIDLGIERLDPFNRSLQQFLCAERFLLQPGGELRGGHPEETSVQTHECSISHRLRGATRNKSSFGLPSRRARFVARRRLPC